MTCRRLLAGLAVATAITLSACGNSPTNRPAAAPPSSAPIETTAPQPTAPPAPAATARVARLKDEGAALAIYSAPGGAERQRLAPTTEFGSPRALRITADAPGWLEVALPDRPNGSTGWVDANAVTVVSIDVLVRVDLAARTLVAITNGQPVIETPVAVGSAANPTPTGSFYVTDLVATEQPSGPYGPFAVGLSAHSDTLTQFGGGDGQIAIHGTNQPTSIGTAASHGCIRVPNDVVTRLIELLPLGTPVEIA